MQLLGVFVAGLLFALGLGISGMTQPQKIIAFLDVTGDWAYQLADILSFIMVLAIIKLCFTFPPMSSCHRQSRWWIAIPLVTSLVVALFTHPCHNLNSWGDVTWTAALYLECFVMLPQIMLVSDLSKDGAEVEALTSHYIACTFVYRFLNFYFLYSAVTEVMTI